MWDVGRCCGTRTASELLAIKENIKSERGRVICMKDPTLVEILHMSAIEKILLEIEIFMGNLF